MKTLSKVHQALLRENKKSAEVNEKDVNEFFDNIKAEMQTLEEKCNKWRPKKQEMKRLKDEIKHDLYVLGNDADRGQRHKNSVYNRDMMLYGFITKNIVK